MVQQSDPGRAGAGRDSYAPESLIEQIPDAIIATGLDHRVVAWSAGAEALYGWSAEEAIGRPVHVLMHPDLGLVDMEALFRELQSTSPITQTLERLRKDGSRVLTETRLVLLRNEAGKPAGIMSISRDVSEQELARARALDELRVRGHGDRLNEAELVMTLDGSIVHANDRAIEIYGYSLDELRRLNIRSLRAESTRDDVPEQMHAAYREGLRFETNHRRKDGTVFRVEVSSRGFDIGGERFLHSLIRDVTAARAEEGERRLLAGLIRSMADAVIITDPGFRITEYTGDAELIYGWSRDEAIGRSVALDFETEYLDGDEAEVAARLDEGRTFRTRMRVRRKDGGWAVVDVLAVPELDPDGTLQGWLLVAREIGAQLASELALRESEEQMQTILAAMAEGVIVHSSTGRTMTWNPAAERILGLTPDQMAGRAPMPSGWRILREDGTPYPNDELPSMRVLRTGEPVSDETMAIQRPDGSHIWVEASAELLRRSPDEPSTGVVTTISNVTERVQRRRSLSMLTSRLASVLQGTNDGSWDWDVPTGHVWYSPRWASMLGYEPHELEPSFATWERLIHPDDRAGALAAADAMLRGDVEEYSSEHRLRHRDGHWAWILNRGRVVERDDEGHPIRAAGTHMDMTERREAREAMERALEENRALVDELRDALDRIRTLTGLLPICMYCKRIREDDGTWERIEEYVSAHSEAQFSHGLCPDCLAKHHGDAADPA